MRYTDITKSSLRRRHGLGFTLIELLVVIAIIAILAAILFPVFARAQENARTLKCASNCRQMMTALQSYLQDYNFRLPNGTFVAYDSLRPRYLPYVRNHDVTRCSEYVVIRDWGTGVRQTQNYAYAYNHCLCGPNKVHNRVPSTIASRCDVWKNEDTLEGWSGRPISDICKPACTPAIFCSRPRYRSPQGFYYSYQWEPMDIANADRMRNPHGGGTCYGFLDGHAKWYPPAGDGFLMATAGIDYDGNGSVGGRQFMR
jgi:prepilin-type N-terminal cleavage/methylation domain-containing protein/prepilin-type processing-associated H-X9-DG protein